MHKTVSAITQTADKVGNKPCNAQVSLNADTRSSCIELQTLGSQNTSDFQSDIPTLGDISDNIDGPGNPTSELYWKTPSVVLFHFSALFIEGDTRKSKVQLQHK